MGPEPCAPNPAIGLLAYGEMGKQDLAVHDEGVASVAVAPALASSEKGVYGLGHGERRDGRQIDERRLWLLTDTGRDRSCGWDEEEPQCNTSDKSSG